MSGTDPRLYDAPYRDAIVAGKRRFLLVLMGQAEFKTCKRKGLWGSAEAG